MKKTKESFAVRPAVRAKDFSELMKGVPVSVFVSMVTRAGLPSGESAELCKSFKDLVSKG